MRVKPLLVVATLSVVAGGCSKPAPPPPAPPPSPAATPTPAPPPAPSPVVAATPSPSPSAIAAPTSTAAARLAALDNNPGAEAQYQAILTRLAAKTGETEDKVAEGVITVHNTTQVSCLQSLQAMEASAK